MYNADQKVRFLDATAADGGQRTWAVQVFDSVQETEQRLSKDVAEMTADEVATAMVATGSISSLTISNRKSFIVRYKKWCADNGLDTVLMKTSDILIDVSDNIRNAMVYSPSQLADILTKAFPDSGAKTIAPVYRSYLWFAFAGLQETEAVRVKQNDINFGAKVVSFNGKWFALCDESIADIRNAIKLERIDRVGYGAPTRSYQRADGDEVLRGRKLSKEISPENYVKKTLRTVVQIAFARSGHNGCSFVQVRKSGIFFSFLQREMSGFAVNFYTVAYDDYEYSHPNSRVSESSKRKSIQRYAHNYSIGYEQWKKAFEQELKQTFDTGTIPGI